jgi:hypothetical protein
MATTEQERRISRENGRLVAQAINDGRVSVDRAPHWLRELKRDPAGSRRVLASLAPGLIPGSRGVPLVNVNPMQSALDPGMPPAPAPQERPTRTISLGGGLIRMEAQMIAGKPREEWTEDEGRAWFLHQLGPKFRAPGVKPPKDPVWYIPTDSIRHTTDAAWGQP